MGSLNLQLNSVVPQTQPQQPSRVTNNVIPQMPSRSKTPHFGANELATTSIPVTNIRTELTTKEEQEKYIALFSNLSNKEDKKNLNLLLKSGILLNNKSNDKSTTLDNLYNILSTPRAEGLEAQKVLHETIKAIANPFTITQRFGNMPKQYLEEIPKNVSANPKVKDDVINKDTISGEASNTCVAASIEFNLAMKSPAEFTRFAQGLTSPNVAVPKTINLKNLTDNTLDSVWLLNQFEVPYTMKDFDKAQLVLAPDKNAIVRAQIQNNDKDDGERSMVDVLMQSTFMNVGSQQAYDSLTDMRGGKFNDDNRGLIEFEKTFTESVVEDKNKISVQYQILDDNGKISGYTTDFNTMKKQIIDSLKMGQSVIIGYTYTINKKDLKGLMPKEEIDKKFANGSDEMLSGHEITIIGAVQDKKGDLMFICNDTDDDNSNPVVYQAEYLLPKIHHAGLPKEVVEKDTKIEDSWRDGLQAFQDAKKA